MIEEITISRVAEVVKRKQIEYMDKYKCPPRYVKLPQWVVEKLEEECILNRTFFTIEQDEKINKICGLIIDSTSGIETLEEIEVY